MASLEETIARAQAAQYPSQSKPSMTPYQKATKLSEKDKWVAYLDQHLSQAGFTVVPSVPQVKTFGWNIVERELQFHPERKWRFDRAISYKKIGIEVDGGSFAGLVKCHRCLVTVMKPLKSGGWYPVRAGGRHNTGAGLEADHEKFNAAVALGWRVLRFVPTQIKNGYALNLITSLAKNPSF
jgi:hypothetical protein